MLKFLTIIFTSYCIVQVQSCNKSKSPSQSSCPEHKYMEYGTRSVLSKYPGNLKIGQLSIAGTRNSLSKGLGPNLETQDLSIEDQLDFGVRALEISVTVLFNVFRLQVDTIYLNETFRSFIETIYDFLEKHPLELVILLMKYDGVVRYDETQCNNKCDAFERYANDEDVGWRLVTKWSLDDDIKRHRGKILLATNSHHFKNDVFYLNPHCSILENQVSSAGENDHVESRLEYKWKKYVEMTKNSELDHHRCFIYNLGIDVNTPLTRKISKYGGYYYENQCIQPMNYRFSNYHSEIRPLSLRMYFFEFITQIVIDHVNNETVWY